MGDKLRDARRIRRAEERARLVAEAKSSAGKGATGYLLAQAASVLQESKKRFEALERERREAAAAIPANETMLARRRREERAKADYEKRLQHAKDLHAHRVQEQRKYDELKAKAHKLHARLYLRPNDSRSLQLLVQVVYDMKDYLAAVQVIGRAIKNPELASSRLYILLGRCHLRFYMKDGTVPDLDLALVAYREAMRDPDLHRAAASSPVPYFELAGLLLRLGKHQMALDTLGASMTIFKAPEHAAWTLLGQHNVAQILVLVGDFDGAMQLYLQLQTCPLLVEPVELSHNGGGDHCVLGSTRLVSVLLSVEMACLHHRLGNTKLATALLVECFDRRVRTASFLGPENGGDVDICLGFGPGDAGLWVSTPSTFKRLGDLFRTREKNLALAAELYGRAAELANSVLGSGSREERQELLGLVLDRAECLAELRNDEEAEAAAYFAYDLMPLDVVVVGRAARCCLRGSSADNSDGVDLLPEKNRVILTESLRVFKAVNCILRILRRYLARRRREARLALGYYATKIASVIRMNLARSSTADARLQVVATARIGRLVYSLRHVWKTGRAALDMYVELWSLSVKGIQHMIRMFLFRKRVTRMSRAVTAAKALWRAHRVRNTLRVIVANVQAWLSAGGSGVLPAVGPLVGLAALEGGGVELLSAGVNILTNDQNLPVVKGQTIGEYSLQGKTRAARRVSPPKSGSLGSAWFSSSSVSASVSNSNSSSSLLAATASFCSQEELEEHVEGCALLGEDVPCLISIKSVKDDATVRWVPIGILPDEAVGRLLTATALVITSQTFSVADCKRLAYVARLKQQQWRSISSLIVHGTKMGPRGFAQFLALGIRHLHTLSLTAVGLLPGLGVVLGQVLANLLSATTLGGAEESSCRLTKLYIDSEPKFGSKGVVALCKYLQYNSTLKILSFRDCHLGRECVSSLASYISLSTSLEVLHLADNPALRCQDCRLLLRSVANKGLRGALRGLHLQGLDLSLDELEALYREGLHLGVGVVAPKLGFRKELQGEIDAAARSSSGNKSGLGTEERRMQELGKAVEERLRLHQLDTTEENRVLKELFF